MILYNSQASLRKLDSPWAASLQEQGTGIPRDSVSPPVKWAKMLPLP